MLPIVLPRASMQQLAAHASTGAELRVDLEAQRIVLPDGGQLPFAIDPLRREGLLTGVDEVTRTLQRTGAIDEWQLRDRNAHPWLWQPVSQLQQTVKT
jgi:3-isopropylmalate/(R)-2-methylmalate dehydratase small subunit